MQIYEAAEKALQDIGRPTHLREIFAHIQERNYFEFGAVDPVRVLGVAIDRHSKGVAISRPASPTLFYRAGPAIYGLLSSLDKATNEDVDLDAEITKAAESEGLDSSLFLEQESQRCMAGTLPIDVTNRRNLVINVNTLQQQISSGGGHYPIYIGFMTAADILSVSGVPAFGM